MGLGCGILFRIKALKQKFRVRDCFKFSFLNIQCGVSGCTVKFLISGIHGIPFHGKALSEPAVMRKGIRRGSVLRPFVFNRAIRNIYYVSTINILFLSGLGNILSLYVENFNRTSGEFPIYELHFSTEKCESYDIHTR